MAYFSCRGKSVYFETHGQGTPVLFLHGNTASSRMFTPLMPLYAGQFQCILMDFLGNGRSQRVDRFSPDLWQDEGLQAAALVRHLNLGKIHLIGTSGGAWAAVNAALACPELFASVIADSFDGRTLNGRFSGNLLAERAAAKENPQARAFYEWCQGPDWEQVVDCDTQALLACAAGQRPLFRAPLSALQIPVLLTGSREDEMCRRDLAQEYAAMAALIPEASIHLFDHGGHPAILSNAEAFARRAAAFIMQHG